MWVRLEEYLELLDAEAGITHDTAQGKRINRIVAPNSENANAIGHDNMPALPQDAKASFFRSSNSI